MPVHSDTAPKANYQPFPVPPRMASSGYPRISLPMAPLVPMITPLIPLTSMAASMASMAASMASMAATMVSMAPLASMAPLFPMAAEISPRSPAAKPKTPQMASPAKRSLQKCTKPAAHTDVTDCYPSVGYYPLIYYVNNANVNAQQREKVRKSTNKGENNLKTGLNDSKKGIKKIPTSATSPAFNPEIRLISSETNSNPPLLDAVSTEGTHSSNSANTLVEVSSKSPVKNKSLEAPTETVESTIKAPAKRSIKETAEGAAKVPAEVPAEANTLEPIAREQSPKKIARPKIKSPLQVIASSVVEAPASLISRGAGNLPTSKKTPSQIEKTCLNVVADKETEENLQRLRVKYKNIMLTEEEIIKISELPEQENHATATKGLLNHPPEIHQGTPKVKHRAAPKFKSMPRLKPQLQPNLSLNAEPVPNPELVSLASPKLEPFFNATHNANIIPEIIHRVEHKEASQIESKKTCDPKKKEAMKVEDARKETSKPCRPELQKGIKEKYKEQHLRAEKLIAEKEKSNPRKMTEKEERTSKLKAMKKAKAEAESAIQKDEGVRKKYNVRGKTFEIDPESQRLYNLLVARTVPKGRKATSIEEIEARRQGIENKDLPPLSDIDKFGFEYALKMQDERDELATKNRDVNVKAELLVKIVDGVTKDFVCDPELNKLCSEGYGHQLTKLSTEERIDRKYRAILRALDESGPQSSPREYLTLPKTIHGIPFKEIDEAVWGDKKLSQSKDSFTATVSSVLNNWFQTIIEGDAYKEDPEMAMIVSTIANTAWLEETINQIFLNEEQRNNAKPTTTKKINHLALEHYKGNLLHQGNEKSSSGEYQPLRSHRLPQRVLGEWFSKFGNAILESFPQNEQPNH
ncbi:hypothetical protein FOA43_002781 [Brettanomyces nanus]|uniref:Uncharacterized protein n=1 Tax=Eeniella nana TaxID=13502 RepID=A0A875RVC8_EENNA|nr:uncharacterized protein FOA43_002781 [Brettanomyces nanus]QPG75427.1 hypothetical protein FOA43_002781 [Brettanomyces nanus]